MMMMMIKEIERVIENDKLYGILMSRSYTEQYRENDNGPVL